jgi:small subunit ribosomal protein S7
MSRRSTAKKREITPDPIYRSRLVSMMVSRLLEDGKKSLASRLFYQSLEHIETAVSGGTADSKTGATRSSNKESPSSPQAENTASSGNTTSSSMKVFQQAVLNVTPVVEVKSRRVGGANYQVPLEVSTERGTALALRWIVQAARQRPGREMALKLANELMDASNKTGNAIRKREETHKMAEANKAFASYRFGA